MTTLIQETYERERGLERRAALSRKSRAAVAYAEGLGWAIGLGRLRLALEKP